MPRTESGKSAWQGCNLVEINGGICTTEEKFYECCEAGAIMGTLQAGYTTFNFIDKAAEEVFKREALLGVSITGWVNSPDILFNKDILRKGAELVLATNKRVAKLIGINPAARTTCCKPSGNASVLLGTASGIHGEHSQKYIRNVQMDILNEVVKTISKYNPSMLEESVWSTSESDYCISFPIEVPEGSLCKSELLGTKQLELVKIAQENWVEYGTDESLCVDKRLRHNVSNTITVDDWDEVEQYVFDNRYVYAGISFMSETGDKAFNQAPFTEVKDPEDVLTEYGVASMFASGLIVDALAAFNDSLWSACDTAFGYGDKMEGDCHKTLLKRDWIRRFKKFAKNYFAGSLLVAANCLKDVYNLHKWDKITINYRDINWLEDLSKRTFIDVDTLGAVACSGGACEITF